MRRLSSPVQVAAINVGGTATQLNLSKECEPAMGGQV
jgi:hypothetical protein